jgi:hypothetical protein
VTYRPESREAYQNADSGKMEKRVLVYLHNSPQGLTCDEFIAITGSPHQSASPAFTALEQNGVIIRTSTRRPTRSGAMAAVYMLAEPGSLFSRPRPGRADAMRAVIKAAFTARATGDWGDFDAAIGELPEAEQRRLKP